MFQFRSLAEVKKLLIQRGESVSDSDDDDNAPANAQIPVEVEGDDDESRQDRDKGDGEPVPKKKRFSKERAGVYGKSDPLPPEFRHLRESERGVNIKFYKACAALAGRDM